MATKTNAVVSTELTRAEAVAIALSLRPAQTEQSQIKGAGFMARFLGNRIAGASAGFSAIVAGAERAQANYAVCYQLESLRQAERTADLVLELDQQRRRLGLSQ